MFGSPWMNGENWMNSRSVFVTGGTVYLGQRLIQELLTRGHRVRALTRPGSGGRLPPNCVTVLGDALDPASYQNQIHTLDTFVQLVGVGHPQSVQSRTVSQRGPFGWSRGRPRCETCRRAAFCLCQRGAARTCHEGIRQGSSGVRGIDTPERDECDDSSALVCSRTPPPLALCSHSHLSVVLADTGDSRKRKAPRIGYTLADGQIVDTCSGKPFCQRARHLRATDPLCSVVKRTSHFSFPNQLGEPSVCPTQFPKSKSSRVSPRPRRGLHRICNSNPLGRKTRHP